MALFRDRADAAERLVNHLPPEIDSNWVILGLPRGGVPLAAAIADHLGATLDILVVRKVGAPGNPEVAMAAVTGPDADECTANEGVLSAFHITPSDLAKLARPQADEVAARQAEWQDLRPQVSLSGRKVLIVDDGIATGTTMAAAVAAVERQGAAKIALAVPVALEGALQRYQARGLKVICPAPEARLASVGQAYKQFPQVENSEVRDLLRRAQAGPGPRNG